MALNELEKRGWQVECRYGMSSIDGARARLATWAVLRGYKWLFWIDGDIGFSAAQFLQFAEDTGQQFECVPYMMKSKNAHAAVAGYPDGPDINRRTRGKFRIQAAGFGFMKTHRAIYEAMIDDGLPTCQNNPNGPPIIPFFQPRWWPALDGSNRQAYYGEDYSFCLHAEKLGFQLIANFDIDIMHIGRYGYRIREDSFDEEEGIAIRTQIVRLGSVPPHHPLCPKSRGMMGQCSCSELAKL